MKCATALVAMHMTVVDGWRPESRTYVDHDSLPVRCHMVDEDHADLCTVALETIELSWDVQVGQLGFADPILDDDDRFDVYVTTEWTDGGAYVAGEGGDAIEDDGRMGQPSYMALDPTIPDDEFASYVAHEFNHVVQYSMDYIEPTLPVWEATATAAEAWTLDDYKIWGDWVADFQAYPWMGILGDSYIMWDDYGIWSYHEYGAGIWILHLDETYYDGTGEGGAELWWALVQNSRVNEPDVLDAWGEVTGSTWQDALTEFVAFNLISHDPDRRPAWVDAHDDGAWGSVPMETLQTADLPATVAPEWGVAPTGWVHVELPDAPEDLVVSVEGQGSANLALVSVDATGSVQVTTTWPAHIEQTGAIDIAVVNLGEPEFDADDALIMRPLELSFAVEADDDTDDDTGDTDTDDADDSDGIVDDDPDSVTPERNDTDKGGCSVTGSAAGWTILATVLVAMRRREGASPSER
jgi:hypothetical protein